jgi:hypothetical protein
MGRHSKYPYDDWTDGKWHVVDPAKYGTTPEKLRAIVHQWAKAHNYACSTYIDNVEKTFSIRLTYVSPHRGLGE